MGGRLRRGEGALVSENDAGHTSTRYRRCWLLWESGRAAVLRGALVGAADLGRGGRGGEGGGLLGHGRSWNGSLTVEA